MDGRFREGEGPGSLSEARKRQGLSCVGRSLPGARRREQGNGVSRPQGRPVGLSWAERAGGSLWSQGTDPGPGDVTGWKVSPRKKEAPSARRHFSIAEWAAWWAVSACRRNFKMVRWDVFQDTGSLRYSGENVS